MARGTLDTEISIEDTKYVRITRGHLTISSTETIHIDKIEGSIILELRGKSHKNDLLLSFPVTTQKQLIKNEVYEIPFIFRLEDSMIDSYEGKIIQISYKCQISILVKKEDQQKLEGSLFTKGKFFGIAQKSIKTFKYFQVESITNRYQIIETTMKFSFKLDLPMYLLAMFLSIGLSTYTYFIPEMSVWYTALIIIFILVGILLIIKGVERAIGIISMETFIDDKAFRYKIKKPKNINVSDALIYYEIIERVRVENGDSSTTYNEIVYTSDKQQLSEFNENKNLEFSFPEKLGLHPVKYHGVSRIWEMKLEDVHYFGFPLKYDCYFEVERVYN